MNLLVNAFQAIEEKIGGRSETGRIRLRTRGRAASCVVVSVSDTGTGIAPRIWRASSIPSSRPRRSASGPGSGLSTCYSIVRRQRRNHHGREPARSRQHLRGAAADRGGRGAGRWKLDGRLSRARRRRRAAHPLGAVPEPAPRGLRAADLGDGGGGAARARRAPGRRDPLRPAHAGHQRPAVPGRGRAPAARRDPHADHRLDRGDPAGAARAARRAGADHQALGRRKLKATLRRALRSGAG